VVSILALGRSVGLAGHMGDTSAMGFVNSNAHRGRVANLDHLVVGLVSRSCGEQGEANESLKQGHMFN